MKRLTILTAVSGTVLTLAVQSLYAQSEGDVAGSNLGHITDTVIVSEGKRYVGEYPVGEGVLFSGELGIVRGEFKEGVPHGQCVYFDLRNRRYSGTFTNGLITGYGQMFYGSGRVVSGWFKDGRNSGIDTVYYKDSSVYIGLFEAGVKVKGKGKLYKKYPDFLKGCKPEFTAQPLTAEEQVFFDAAYDKLTAGDHPARFQGMDKDAFSRWVTDHLKYPPEAKKKRIEGTVTVKFTVSKTGEVKDAELLTYVDPLINREAIRVIMSSPLWEPAVQYGKKVNMVFTLPVIFALR